MLNKLKTFFSSPNTPTKLGFFCFVFLVSMELTTVVIQTGYLSKYPIFNSSPGNLNKDVVDFLVPMHR